MSISRVKFAAVCSVVAIFAVGVTGVNSFAVSSANVAEGINIEDLVVMYQGEQYSWNEIERFQRQDKAMVEVFDSISGAQGIAHAFDTATEADAWACHVRPSAGC